MPRRARTLAGHTTQLSAQRRLLGPLSVAPVTATAANGRPMFSTKICDYLEFYTTKHPLLEGLIFDQTPLLRTSSKQVPTYQVQAPSHLLEISPDHEKARIASAVQARQRLRRPPLRSGPTGDPPGRCGTVAVKAEMEHFGPVSRAKVPHDFRQNRPTAGRGLLVSRSCAPFVVVPAASGRGSLPAGINTGRERPHGEGGL